MDSHSVSKASLELFSSPKEIHSLDQITLTAIFVTNCGNFGLLGFSNGGISKINLQSGLHQISFQMQQSFPIVALHADAYNKKILVANSQGLISFFQFHSGLSLSFFTVGSCPHFSNSKFPHFLCILGFSTFIHIWDLSKEKLIRCFATSIPVLDSCLSSDSRFLFASFNDSTFRI